MITAKILLKTHWGFTDFRPKQADIINAVANGKDVIALLPTGGGKSICYQIPALLNSGICIVISPLIALMQDQINGLKAKQIKALSIPSGSSTDTIVSFFDVVKFSNTKFLFLSPERLQSKLIQQKIKELNVNLIAVDEAHCISEWGHDFRPSYRHISVLKTLLPNTNLIALTATADAKVIQDIATNLQLHNPTIFKTSFFRKNLAYQIFKIEDKLGMLLSIFKKKVTPAIIYCNSRKKTEELAHFLNANNYKSTYYHAGLLPAQKKENFNHWLEEKTPIMVATNAFGMGIDKANIGIVIHFNLPSSIENYVQEVGRAGRNNAKAFGVLLYNDNDVYLHQKKIKANLPTLNDIKTIHKKLYQHFQIAYGELPENTYQLHFLEFCKKYNFNPVKVTAVLKILTNYGIINLHQNFNKKSLVKITSSHQQFLKSTNNNKQLKHFTTILLRTYGGLFENDTKIDEYLLAKKANTTSKNSIEFLNTLAAQDLISYQKTDGNSSLQFLVPREDDISINTHKKGITQFLELKLKKSEQLIQFVTNNTNCRSQLLLNYFDEANTINCGICDYCITKKNSKVKDVSTKITLLLKTHKCLSSKEICSYLNALDKDVLIHLQHLLNNNTITVTTDNKYQLKT